MQANRFSDSPAKPAPTPGVWQLPRHRYRCARCRVQQRAHHRLKWQQQWPHKRSCCSVRPGCPCPLLHPSPQPPSSCLLRSQDSRAAVRADTALRGMRRRVPLLQHHGDKPGRQAKRIAWPVRLADASCACVDRHAARSAARSATPRAPQQAFCATARARRPRCAPGAAHARPWPRPRPCFSYAKSIAFATSPATASGALSAFRSTTRSL